MALARTSEARLDGIGWAEIEVKGKTYEVPLANPKFEQKVYYIKKALGGDKEARDIVLGGRERAEVFIGDGDNRRWLYITKTDEWVEEI